MGPGIFALEVMAIIRGYHRQEELPTDLKKPCIAQGRVFNSIFLEFDKKPSALEDLAIFLCGLEGFLHLPPARQDGNLSFEASAEANQTLVIFAQKFLIDPRLIIESFEMSETDQFNEVKIACPIFDQKGEMKGSPPPFRRRFLLKAASGGHIKV